MSRVFLVCASVVCALGLVACGGIGDSSKSQPPLSVFDEVLEVDQACRMLRDTKQAEKKYKGCVFQVRGPVMERDWSPHKDEGLFVALEGKDPAHAVSCWFDPGMSKTVLQLRYHQPALIQGRLNNVVNDGISVVVFLEDCSIVEPRYLADTRRTPFTKQAEPEDDAPGDLVTGPEAKTLDGPGVVRRDKSVYVKGYYRNGKYVQGHQRRSPRR